MNSNQKAIISIAAVAMFAMLFFPPTQFSRGLSLDQVSGYQFIGDTLGDRINWGILAIQWVATSLLAAVLYWVAGK